MGRFPGSSLDRATARDAGLDLTAAKAAAQQPSNGTASSTALRAGELPIHTYRNQLLYAVEHCSVVIVSAPTGSGKTTQLPQYLYEAGWAQAGKQIVCTQPRRVAAVSIAARVAHEVGSVMGDEVGYAIRFEDNTTPERTRIKFTTDGALVRECLFDPLLREYSVILVDEVHERSANTDMLLGLLRKIRRRRPELRIIISSATMDADALAEYFRTPASASGSSKGEDDVGIVHVEGRTFPVDIAYVSQPVENYVRAAVETVLEIDRTGAAGDVLIFLTGRDEIQDCLQMLSNTPQGRRMELLPLHAGLAMGEQAAIFHPAERGRRKIIASTNVAETSVTIDGVRFVVDSGMVKLSTYDPHSGLSSLTRVPASQASAAQRAGRAGRTAPGTCYRLYPEQALASMPPMTLPELARIDLSGSLLQLLALGVTNLVKFDWVPPPPPSALVVDGLDFLAALGAVDEHGRLTTSVGEQLAELSLPPAMGKALLASPRYGCTEQMLSIAAMSSVSSPFLGPGSSISGLRRDAVAEANEERARFAAAEGDTLTLLNVFTAFVHPRHGDRSSSWAGRHRLNHRILSRAISIRTQLARTLTRLGITCAPSPEAAVTMRPLSVQTQAHAQTDDGSSSLSRRIRQCLTEGLFRNAARLLPDGTYSSARSHQKLHVQPTSVLYNVSPDSKWVLFGEVIETSRKYITDLTVIEQDWLLEAAYVPPPLGATPMASRNTLTLDIFCT